MQILRHIQVPEIFVYVALTILLLLNLSLHRSPVSTFTMKFLEFCAVDLLLSRIKRSDFKLSNRLYWNKHCIPRIHKHCSNQVKENIMNQIFSIDNRFIQLLNKIFCAAWLNILWFYVVFPIFTIGASTTALYYVSFKLVRNEEGNITKQFFTAFRSISKKKPHWSGSLFWGLASYLELTAMCFIIFVWKMYSGLYAVQCSSVPELYSAPHPKQ